MANVKTGHPEEATVRIPAGKAILEGDLDLPASAGGLVIFAHGSGSSRHSPRNRAVAQFLRQAGLGTLLFDLLTAAEEREDLRTGGYRFNISYLAGAALDRVQAPTLLIVGGNDQPVLAMNREALGKLRSEKELVIVPGASHLFEERGTLEEVARLAASWFRKHLTGIENR